MGIKTLIHSSQLPSQYQHYKLIPTVHGVMATTYLLNDSYVLKLFEDNTAEEILEGEVTLLSNLDNLPVPKVIDRFQIEGKAVILYTQMHGESIVHPCMEHIKEVALFLKAFHTQSKNILLPCTERFTKVALKQLIVSTYNPSLMQHFYAIDLTLKSEGVIHGDLFPDNCKFKANTLSGIYDFSDACLGDLHFDLAVVAVGWCFEKEILNMQKTEMLLHHYGSHMDPLTFISYIRYALLYYATTRYIARRDYPILLKRLESIS